MPRFENPSFNFDAKKRTFVSQPQHTLIEKMLTAKLNDHDTDVILGIFHEIFGSFNFRNSHHYFSKHFTNDQHEPSEYNFMEKTYLYLDKHFKKNMSETEFKRLKHLVADLFPSCFR